jgi:glycerol-3-phosphate dehydrogenase
VLVSKSGLVTVTGGKWTTYRRMGQDAIDHAALVAGLPKVASRTLDLKLHGWTENVAGLPESERVYGSDLPLLKKLSEDDPALGALLHPRLPYRLREVVWAARHEMARTVEDVLARRTRALFLDAKAAIEAAPAVADLLAKELGRSEAWRDKDLANFYAVAQGYVYEEM